jgi:long-chain acyl-CoA synthetase
MNAYRSVVEMLDDAARRYAGRAAFVCSGETLTYADVDRLARDFAAYLQARLGVREGDRVAVMLPNVAAFPVATLGILRCGAVQVNVNPLYTPRELEHQLKDSGARVLVTDAPAARAEVVGSTSVERVISAREALEDGAHLPFAAVSLRSDDLMLLQYTGGTTGVSKGAALTHGNLLANVEQIRAALPDATRPAEEVVVTALPLYHVFALTVNLVTYFAVGAENWLVPNARDLDALVDVLASARCTAFTGVNTLFAGLVAHPRIGQVDFSRLRAAIGGGAAVLRVTSERWRAITGRHILEGYGLSETSPVLTLAGGDGSAFSETVGHPLASTEIKLLDAQDREVPVGEAGEICARGPQVMRGYWGKPEANRAAFTADGYFRTGDIGVFDAHGRLKIVDRKKDMIIVSGFNVYPNEVEAIVAAMPGVVECACVGVRDEKTGEAVRVYVVRSPGAALAEGDVQSHCRRELAGYKVPRQVVFLDALPKSPVGKILRKQLREAP